jgi:hypothetical protein
MCFDSFYFYTTADGISKAHRNSSNGEIQMTKKVTGNDGGFGA